MVVGTDWTGLSQTGQKTSDKSFIGWWLIRRKIAKIAAEQKLLSHTALKVFSLVHLQPLLSSTVIYYYTERSIYKAESPPTLPSIRMQDLLNVHENGLWQYGEVAKRRRGQY